MSDWWIATTALVHTIAYSRTRQRETAEDLAQEVFLRTYLSLGQITIPSQFAGWLVRVTHNLANDWNRQGIRHSKLVRMVPIEELHLEIADDSGKGAGTVIPQREDERALHEAIFRLPEAQRDLVLLHYTEGLSQKEIAERLGVHKSTVGRQLKQAVAVRYVPTGRWHIRVEELSEAGIFTGRSAETDYRVTGKDDAVVLGVTAR